MFVVAFFLQCMWNNLIVTFLCVLSVYVVVKYGYGPFKFWDNIGVPQVKIEHPFIGNLIKNFNMPTHEATTTAYREFPNERFVGMYAVQTPILLVRDPALVEAVLIKDFSAMPDRGSGDDPYGGKLQKNLINLNGEHWKIMRNKLTPTFTSGKLKGMHSQLVECTKSMMKLMKEYEDGRPFEVRKVMYRLTMDVIATTAFGLNIDTINNPDSEFAKMGISLFKPSMAFKILHVCQLSLSKKLSQISRKFLSRSAKFEKFFTGVVDSTIEHRKQKNILRPDFLHLMNEIKLKEQEMIQNGELDGNSPYLFDHTSLISNAFVFFLAGFETTASTLSYCMYELAKNQDVQEKLYEEVTSVLKKHDGDPNYKALADMHYLEQVISETLRVHPPAPSFNRKVTKEYQVPDSEVILRPGIIIHVSAYALHHDPQYFPEPDKFRPERFDEEKNVIRKGTYLPFGDGPRMCIGARFARLEVKVAMAIIIDKYKIMSCEKTKLSLEYGRNPLLLIPEGGIWLAIKPRIDCK